MRITLVAIHPARSPQSVPLAAAFLTAALLNDPASAVMAAPTIVELFVHDPPETCARNILASAPDIVGFSIYAWNRQSAVAVANLLKRAHPELTLWGGGPEATADPERLIGEAPWDLLFLGDGEDAFKRAVTLRAHGRPVQSLPGTACRENGSFTSYPRCEFNDLDHIPSPFLAGIIDPARYDGMLWQLSRGCSFDCDFCFDSGGSRTVRRFSRERVAAELRWLADSNVSQVTVLDSTFNSDRTRAVQILKLIRKTAPGIHFHFEVRSEFLDREQAELFASITCSLQIGLQSSSSDVLKQSGRNLNRADFTSKIHLLNETGAIFGFDLIYGLPGDTLEGFRRTIDFALELYPNHLDIFPLALLPGTKLAARSDRLGLKHQQDPPYRLISSPEFTEDDLTTAAGLAAACDIFYSRGKAVSWFLSVLHPLRMKPSRFLEEFHRYLQCRCRTSELPDQLPDEEIFSLQQDFVSRLYREKRLLKLLPVALDLIAYNHLHAAALMATPPELPGNGRRSGTEPLSLTYRLAESAHLGAFHYDILELLECGSADLKAIAAGFSPTASWAVIYPNNGEVFTESLHERHYRLLKELDGSAAAGKTAAALGLAADDAANFLKFALREGIVTVENYAHSRRDR